MGGNIFNIPDSSFYRGIVVIFSPMSSLVLHTITLSLTFSGRVLCGTMICYNLCDLVRLYLVTTQNHGNYTFYREKKLIYCNLGIFLV